MRVPSPAARTIATSSLCSKVSPPPYLGLSLLLALKPIAPPPLTSGGAAIAPPPFVNGGAAIAPPPGIDPGPWASKAHVLATTQWRNLNCPLLTPAEQIRSLFLGGWGQGSAKLLVFKWFQ